MQFGYLDLEQTSKYLLPAVCCPAYPHLAIMMTGSFLQYRETGNSKLHCRAKDCHLFSGIYFLQKLVCSRRETFLPIVSIRNGFVLSMCPLLFLPRLCRRCRQGCLHVKSSSQV